MKSISNLRSIDLAMFAGQSNMSGRGNAAEAVQCSPLAGFEYKAISSPNTLLPIKEPFGLGEDKTGAIADFDSQGRTKRTGSMVSAVVNEYYALTGRQLAAVSASIGGSTTSQWMKTYVFDAVERLDKAKKFLAETQYCIDKVFLVWCQGESDGDSKMTASDYIENTMCIFHTFQSHGVQKCFVVQTGHYNYLKYPHVREGLSGMAWDKQYEIIRTAQNSLCQKEKDIILAGSFEPYLEEMKDPFHYTQKAYNMEGKAVGASIAHYFTSESL